MRAIKKKQKVKKVCHRKNPEILRLQKLFRSNST